jgi:resuscitation-promoting factor RpfB
MPISESASLSPRLTKTAALVLLVLLILLSGCNTHEMTAGEESVTIWIELEGGEKQVTLSLGATVQNALDEADIQLDNLDKVKPPTFTTLTNGDRIQVVRVREQFEIEEMVIPFQSQTVRNESLPEGQRRLIQSGENGIQQITYRQIFEDEVPGPRTIFRAAVIKEAKPEILMVGVQAPFAPITIPGMVAYLTSGNAWIMENTTGERYAVVNTGDLDGRVFRLSPDGSWLLYTRRAGEDDPEAINTLWAVNVREKASLPIDLKVKNIIHFADWVPGKEQTIVYSTVEPRTSAPGWQANNDLQLVSISRSGAAQKPEEIIEANFGGIYGWWGTHFAWSPEGERLAYARPDGVGWVDLEEQTFVQLMEIIPLQTRSDWAWVPGIDWSVDGSLIYTVAHIALPGLASDEASPLFDVCAVMLENPRSVCLVSQSGMFAYPSPSPLLPGDTFMVAYLQAIFPDKSESSRYRLMLMDQDGSDRRLIFPPEGSPGLEPQKVIWGPAPVDGSLLWLAAIYQGNLWLINPQNGQAQQITGDGSIAKLDWK